MGDLVYEFGEANYFNNNGLALVKSVVMKSQNEHLIIRVVRGERAVSMVLTPKVWKGQGLLGCRLLPL